MLASPKEKSIFIIQNHTFRDMHLYISSGGECILTLSASLMLRLLASNSGFCRKITEMTKRW